MKCPPLTAIALPRQVRDIRHTVRPKCASRQCTGTHGAPIHVGDLRLTMPCSRFEHLGTRR